MKSNEEKNILESEKESLPYHCKECNCEIDSSKAEDNNGFCDECLKDKKQPKKCKHLYVRYLGLQKKLSKKPMKLYNCVKCGSTITDISNSTIIKDN